MKLVSLQAPKTPAEDLRVICAKCGRIDAEGPTPHGCMNKSKDWQIVTDASKLKWPWQ